MESTPTAEPSVDLLAHEADTFTFEAPASPVDDANELVFFGDRNEGQTLPFADA